MGLSIIDCGDGRFRLEEADREIGWVDHRAIVIAAFPDASAAYSAACTAYDALSIWISRLRLAGATPRRGRTMKVHAEERERVLSVGTRRVGRLVAPTISLPSHGFELLFPPRFGAALVAAQVVYEALRRKRLVEALDTVARHYVPIGGPPDA